MTNFFMPFLCVAQNLHDARNGFLRGVFGYAGAFQRPHGVRHSVRMPLARAARTRRSHGPAPLVRAVCEDQA